MSVPAWVYTFVAPRSYTGEELVELHIPGNAILARMLLTRLIELGARQADPGEFTARAFFNGRIDLTEAEGVAATVAAHSEQELRAARQLMAGELARRLRPVLDLLTETLALVEAGIDFTEEDISFLSEDDARARIAAADEQLERLVGESARFERLSYEPQVVLVGDPNAGKSTRLNALVGHHRAVVSPIAGTTRDALSAEVALKRGIVRIVDVAGLAGVATTEIDQQMQRHALATVESSDLVVLVRDLSDAHELPQLPRSPDLVVRTKLDLAPTAAFAPTEIAVSAVTGANLDRLRDHLDRIAFGAASGTSSSLALNARHLRSIADARAALSRAVVTLDSGGQELLALELRESLDALGQILGTISPDELLGRIFATFCIGK